MDDEEFYVPDITSEDEDEDLTDMEDEDNNSDASLDEDFDFSKFYEEDDEEEQSKTEPVEDMGIDYDEEAYDEILDLHNDNANIAVSATYPYIRIKGFIIKDEVAFMRESLSKYCEEVKNKYSVEEMLDIMFNINGEDYKIGKVPLVLDTFLTIFKAHRYEVTLVRDEYNESLVTSELMKAFLFT